MDSEKLDVKIFGVFFEAHCTSCTNFSDCGGGRHNQDNQSIKARLLEKYGDRVQVYLVNIFSDDMEKFPEVVRHIRSEGMKLPILMIGGKLSIYGIDATDSAIMKAVGDVLGAEQALIK